MGQISRVKNSIGVVTEVHSGEPTLTAQSTRVLFLSDQIVFLPNRFLARPTQTHYTGTCFNGVLRERRIAGNHRHTDARPRDLRERRDSRQATKTAADTPRRTGSRARPDFRHDGVDESDALDGLSESPRRTCDPGRPSSSCCVRCVNERCL